ncbi:MFS transporter [Asticcacaulis sp. 201]|uniref:MFS transporter n=1 Tax=Asticcacaulis sp. 201 TaxID=3028787 RepID=UPI002916673F|nr:MFS transporter [Asticcacaulis sp. 201]MDV6329684.1 MFS transporter [Asticcacaulis sp. 201]
MSQPVSDQSVLQAYEPIHAREVVSYGLGDAGFNLYWAPLSAFMMVYLSDVVGLSLASIASLLVTMRLISAVADPIFGAIADRTHTPYGRYRPWFLWLALPLASAGILFFSLGSLAIEERLTATYISLILLNLIYTAANTAYNALSGVITLDSDQRGLIISARFGGAFLSAAVITWATPKLVALAGRGNHALGWQFVMTVFGVIVAGILVNLFLQTRERLALSSQPNRNPLRDIGNLFANRPWTILFAFGFAMQFAFMLHTAMTPYFMKVCIGRPDLIVGFVMTFTLGLAAGSASAAALTRWLPRQWLIALAMTVAGASSLALYACPSNQTVLMFALEAITGAAFGMASTLAFVMCADTADYNAWKTGHRATAMTYSMIMFGKKIGAAASAALIGAVLAGYAANSLLTQHVLGHIRALISLTPAAICFGAAGIIALYDLTPDRVVKLQAQLLSSVRGKSSNPLP